MQPTPTFSISAPTRLPISPRCCAWQAGRRSPWSPSRRQFDCTNRKGTSLPLPPSRPPPRQRPRPSATGRSACARFLRRALPTAISPRDASVAAPDCRSLRRKRSPSGAREPANAGRAARDAGCRVTNTLRHRAVAASARRDPAVGLFAHCRTLGGADVPELRQENPDAPASAAPAAPRSRPRRAREVRKTVTVLFADVTGSTALGERLDPESLRRVMARYFDAESVRRAPRRHGREVHRRRRHGRLRRPGACTRTTRCARFGPPPRSASALASLNAELERDYGVALESAPA